MLTKFLDSTCSVEATHWWATGRGNSLILR